MKLPKILIVGTGYVGLSTAVILAEAGYKVHTLDIDERKINIIKNGKSYFYELGLDELIKNGLKSGNLIPTTSYQEGLKDADIIFSCVGTPDREDGSSNLDYVFSAAKSVIENAKKDFIYVQKSTVPAGTGKKVIELMKGERTDIKFDYVSNPEFLREGSAVFDTLNMDRLIVGGNNKSAVKSVVDLYRSIDNLSKRIKLSDIDKYIKDNNPNAFKSENKPFDDRVVITNLESAELIKVSANAFLTLKISFSNEIAMLCDKTGADITEVMDGIGFDHRIGRAFLYAGRGYGGGCFPKDVSGLIKTAEDHGISFDIMKASQKRNDSMVNYIVNKLKEANNGTLESTNICVLGLSFKTGTSDVRKSPGIKIANLLEQNSAMVSVYDPMAMEEANSELNNGIMRSKTANDAIKGSDILILATPWEEFKEIDIDTLKQLMTGNTYFDAVNAMDKNLLEQNGFIYLGVGR